MKSNADFVSIELKVVTPLFLGGTSQENAKDETNINIPSELRPPSFKGVLRFWHRAASPDNLKTEAEYFGSTNGQASFLLQVQKQPKIHTDHNWDKKLDYLGYGPITRKDGQSWSRQYIEPGEVLKFRLVFRPDASKDVKEAVFRSFRLLSLFGGLGSRSRRGFGSVVMTSMLFKDQDELEEQIRREISQCPRPKLEDIKYTAISHQTRILVLAGYSSWEEALQQIGNKLQKYRSFRTKPPESSWPKKDHDLVRSFLENKSINEAPSRSVFGLPHNYYFSSLKGAKAVVEGNDAKFSRRASPLFIHIHMLGNGKYAVVVAFFPAPFLPNGVSLVVTTARETSQPLIVPSWEPIDEFLNYLVEKHDAREVI